MNPKVSIIILNWNGWKDTIECLESIYQINYSNYDVITVDNNSNDDSVQKIKEYCKGKIKVKSKYIKYNPLNKPIKSFEYTEREIKVLKDKDISNIPSNEKLTIIKNEKNYGFAGGNNVGIRYALNHTNSQYILLLNNDTIVGPDFLTELIKVAEKDKKIGSVQPLLLKPDGKFIDSSGQEISTWSLIDKGINSKYDKPFKEDEEIFGACAAAALYPKEILKDIGLFDEDFFVIFEDVDLSWRIRLKGFKSVLAVDSIVYHKRGVSEEVNYSEISYLMQYHYNKNLLVIMLKYYPLSCIFGAKNLNESLYFIKRALSYSLKANKTSEFIKILMNNLKFRIVMQKDPLLHEIQKKWIKE